MKLKTVALKSTYCLIVVAVNLCFTKYLALLEENKIEAMVNVRTAVHNCIDKSSNVA